MRAGILTVVKVKSPSLQILIMLTEAVYRIDPCSIFAFKYFRYSGVLDTPLK